MTIFVFFFFSSRRRHTRWPRDWSSDVCSSDLDDVRAGLEVLAVDGLDGRRLRQREQVGVALDVPGMGLEALTPEVRLLEAVRLEHRPHGAVDDDDALGHQRLEARRGVLHASIL